LHTVYFDPFLFRLLYKSFIVPNELLCSCLHCSLHAAKVLLLRCCSF